ncbi:MAG TPA: hypothetical protein VFP98_05955 [Candidatus Polarisedimenticolia bacterium]|nr:hypothetical protein [Candidatus Polarisedimenticolia bacterium]
MKASAAFAILVLLFLQSTGLALGAEPLTCRERCPTDGPDGSCAPLCPECVCCPTLRSCVRTQWVFSSPFASAMAPDAETQPPPLEAEPAEIFHIPRAALA